LTSTDVPKEVLRKL